MATVAFSELVPEVLATAPACPTPTIIRNLRNSARELCEGSDCYRYTLENTVVIAEQADVELDLPTGTTLHKPITLQLNGKRLEPFSVVMKDRDEEGWRTASGIPLHFLRSNVSIDAVRLMPIPDATYTTMGLVGEVAVKPARDSVAVDEIFMDRFHTVVVDGALARLLAIASAPWYAPQLAAYHKQLFDIAKDEARAIADGDDMPKRRIIPYGGI